jgi:uncharacterized protein (TIGR02246 family)
MGTRQDIEKINAEFLDAFNGGDAAAITTGYTEDCAVLVPNQPTVRGRQAVETLFKGMIEEIGGTATLEIVEVAEAGDLAYQWATYTLEGSEISDAGQLVEIFRRQADGSWKVHRSMFNSDNP